jgi:hypothetical protein
MDTGDVFSRRGEVAFRSTPSRNIDLMLKDFGSSVSAYINNLKTGLVSASSRYFMKFAAAFPKWEILNVARCAKPRVLMYLPRHHPKTASEFSGQSLNLEKRANSSHNDHNNIFCEQVILKSENR